MDLLNKNHTDTTREGTDVAGRRETIIMNKHLPTGKPTKGLQFTLDRQGAVWVRSTVHGPRSTVHGPRSTVPAKERTVAEDRMATKRRTRRSQSNTKEVLCETLIPPLISPPPHGSRAINDETRPLGSTHDVSMKDS